MNFIKSTLLWGLILLVVNFAALKLALWFFIMPVLTIYLPIVFISGVVLSYLGSKKMNAKEAMIQGLLIGVMGYFPLIFFKLSGSGINIPSFSFIHQLNMGASLLAGLVGGVISLTQKK